MGEAIGQIIPLALAVALSPLPIVAVVLMLGTPLGRVNGPSFVLGWIVGLTAVGALVIVLSHVVDATAVDGPADWVGWLKLVLGLLLVLLAVEQWRGRPSDGEEQEFPAWMATIDAFTPGKATSLGLVLSAVNPKNLLLTVSAATAIASFGASDADEAVVLAIFIVIATVGPALPVAISIAMGKKATELLDGLRSWMATNNVAIMVVLLLIIGAKMLGDGISLLSA